MMANLRSKKKKSETYWRKKCVELAKTMAKERDGYRCQRCPRSKRKGYQMHGSHVLSEGRYKNMSHDPENIIALCAVCHMWWHENPVDSAAWLEEKFPGLRAALKQKAEQTNSKINKWEENYCNMKNRNNTGN